MMCDFGTGNNNKLNWVLEDKQELIDIIETIYRGAKKGRGLVVSPKGEFCFVLFWSDVVGLVSLLIYSGGRLFDQISILNGARVCSFGLPSLYMGGIWGW